MIVFRKLNRNDNKFLNKLINSEGKNYEEFINMGWTLNQILKQFDKSVNLSIGGFYNNSLICFILGDLFNIEKKSEYEILLIYVCKNYRNKRLGTELVENIVKKNNCLKKIYLEVSENNSEGISFYQKMNFKKVYTRKNYFFYKNKKSNAFVMSKNY